MHILDMKFLPELFLKEVLEGGCCTLDAQLESESVPFYVPEILEDTSDPYAESLAVLPQIHAIGTGLEINGHGPHPFMVESVDVWQVRVIVVWHS